MSEVLLLLSAPLVGILVGLMPSVGMTAMIIVAYPILDTFSPFHLIIFYAIAANAREFSGSVSAINFGLLGEITSAPVIKERSTVISSGHQLTALRNTMLGSMLGVIISAIFLLLALWSMMHFTFLLRTDVLSIFIIITFCFLLWWDNKNMITNVMLLAVGHLIGRIGYDRFNGGEFFTFDNVYLMGGIPTLPLLLGIYAVPKILEIMDLKVIKSQEIKKIKPIRFDWISSVLGSIIGMFCGLIPYIGTTISSNLAYSVESVRSKINNVTQSLSRITSAESANNASQVTQLIPLIALGIALQPSELILLEILEDKGWNVSEGTDWNLVKWLVVGVMLGCVFTSLMCYNFVKPLVFYFAKHIRKITSIFIVAIIANIIWIGHEGNQAIYYLSVFAVCTVIGIGLQKIKVDVVPLVLSFMLAQTLYECMSRLITIHF